MKKKLALGSSLLIPQFTKELKLRTLSRFAHIGDHSEAMQTKRSYSKVLSEAHLSSQKI